jgi:hypothetical protein
MLRTASFLGVFVFRPRPFGFRSRFFGVLRNLAHNPPALSLLLTHLTSYFTGIKRDPLSSPFSGQRFGQEIFEPLRAFYLSDLCFSNVAGITHISSKFRRIYHFNFYVP